MVETHAQTPIQPQASPAQGEPCEECGAPLAVDQRYCVNCGRRRGGPRVDYRHYMGATGPSAAPPVAPPQAEAQAAEADQPSQAQRDYAPLAAVGGIALLGLMLLVGVLIGKGNDDPVSTPTTVIRAPASEGGSETAEGGGSSKNTAGGNGGGNAKKAKQGGGGKSVDTGNAVTASDSELEALSGDSGESYAKKSEELPDEIATPGAPPPIDKSQPPGGGEGGGEVIK